MELALDDLGRAADMLRPIFAATDGVDGWVSMEVSPLLVDDTSGTIEAATRIFAQANRPNLFVKIPGTTAGIAAIEESIFNGVPINVTLLFSREQYLAAAEAYLRGIERRVDAGRDPRVASVASLFVSRWDKATHDRVPPELRNRLGIAVGGITYRAYRELLSSSRWQRLAAAWRAAAAAAVGQHRNQGPCTPPTACTWKRWRLPTPSTRCRRRRCELSPITGRSKVRWLPMAWPRRPRWRSSGKLASISMRLRAQLQREGAQSFAKSWRQLLDRVASKRAGFAKQSRSA